MKEKSETSVEYRVKSESDVVPLIAELVDLRFAPAPEAFSPSPSRRLEPAIHS